jgi:ZIP family zinc transporter
LRAGNPPFWGRAVIEAAFWGLVAASSLVVAAEIAFAVRVPRMVVGLVMAFGVGALLSSVAFELAEPALETSDGFWPVAVALMGGALVYFAGDRVIRAMGGSHRKRTPDHGTDPVDDTISPASGGAIALGTALDGIPESAVLGISLAGGDGISVVLLVAIWISNLPESLASTLGLARGGASRRWIRLMWLGIVAVSAVAAALGYGLVSAGDPRWSAMLQAFAAGALLTMMADEMAPEAFGFSALYAGLATTAGFGLALFLVSLE